MAPGNRKSNPKKNKGAAGGKATGPLQSSSSSAAKTTKSTEEDKDERFVMDSARFNKVPLAVRKVQLDDRFSKVLTDKKFSSGGDMKRFYATNKKDMDDDEDDEEERRRGVTGSGFVWNEVSSDSEESSSDEEDASEVEWDKYNEEAEKANVWSYGDEDQTKEMQGDATSRLAVLGLNWDEVEAQDIFVMFQTFLDSTQKNIFPSDYGLKRLEVEKVRGPVLDSDIEELDAGESSASDTDEEPDMEEERLKKEKEIADPKAHLAQLALRKYQRQRTKYYYAIAEFDSADTGNVVYNGRLELDGIGASFCSLMMDLRFVPDDLEEFPHPPTSTCTEMPKKYQKGSSRSGSPAAPSQAISCQPTISKHSPTPTLSAHGMSLHQSDDFLSKKLTPEDIAEIDLDAYLASSDEESDIDEDNVEDYRKQLLGGELSEDDETAPGTTEEKEEPSAGEMTFKVNTTTRALAEEVEARASALKESGHLGHAGLAAAEKKSPWEQYLEKRRQKDKAKREKRLEARMTAEEEEAKASKVEAGHRKEELEIITGHKESEEGPDAKAKDMEVNVNDPRFSKMFEDTAFAIDPTNPEFKKTKAMTQLMDARIQRKKQLKRSRNKARAAPTTTISKSKVSNLEKRLGPAVAEDGVDLKSDGMKLLGRSKKRHRSSK
ncbi:pre-rRNA-processing protein esf1 [Perkinsus olseni]|uniref:Pre-rRNA-processing protein esf1 n=1 Tax=Perkinsus olseni TaxID=32597 RepID=A0A7J6PEZ1_PEROL|nr:pre-rRNA-processing protein esf1 [Perkinsus olseni]